MFCNVLSRVRTLSQKNQFHEYAALSGPRRRRSSSGRSKVDAAATVEHPSRTRPGRPRQNSTWGIASAPDAPFARILYAAPAMQYAARGTSTTIVKIQPAPRPELGGGGVGVGVGVGVGGGQNWTQPNDVTSLTHPTLHEIEQQKKSNTHTQSATAGTVQLGWEWATRQSPQSRTKSTPSGGACPRDAARKRRNPIKIGIFEVYGRVAAFIAFPFGGKETTTDHWPQ